MTPLWTFEAFAAAVGGRLVGAPPGAIAGISIDSRTLRSGDAFFAIAGDRFDGHAFAADALGAGAAVAVVTEGRTEPDAAIGAWLVVPDDVLRAVERLGVAARARFAGGVVAVTGSVGKTGTTEMLRAALAAVGPTHAPVGSFNNHWGVPLTLARLPADARFGVFEIGMNHAGEIRPLTGFVHPHAAIVTTVGPVHIEHFDDEAGVAEAKAEIFDGLEPGGAAILNRDNRWFPLLAQRAAARGARIIGFGEHPEADVRLDKLALGEDGSSIQAVLHGETIAYRVGAPGRHIAENSLAVVAALDVLGADLPRALLALAGFAAPKGRGERLTLRHRGGPFTLIDESYNANPSSMRAALALLKQARPGPRGRRIAVLGDMLELGAEGENAHRGLVSAVDEAGADLVFLAGEQMHNLWRDLPDTRRGAYAKTGEALEPILLDAIGPGDVVMIKASLGTRLGPVVEAVKRRFSPDAA